MTTRGKKLRDLERRLVRTRDTPTGSTVQALQRNASAQRLLSQWQSVLLSEQTVLLERLGRDRSTAP